MNQRVWIELILINKSYKNVLVYLQNLVTLNIKKTAVHHIEKVKSD
jgi:hypothetical protein